jgi:segregation and condensation protein B
MHRRTHSTHRPPELSGEGLKEMMMAEPRRHRYDAVEAHESDTESAPPPASPQGTTGALPPGISALPSAERREKLRILEALLFAAAEPITADTLARHLDAGEDIGALLAELQGLYAGRGVNLVQVAGKWAFRTAEDLSYLLEKHAVDERRLSKAALETLAIIAYHQPVTRADIEDIRGVVTSKGTLDVLLETGWVRMRGRRRAPGRPITYGTSDAFLSHFGFDSIKDLPGVSELKGAGLLDASLPPDFQVPEPKDGLALMPDEDPLDDPTAQLDLLAEADEEGRAPLEDHEDDRRP